MTTEYNVLYNGNLALEEGLNELSLTYYDDYWNILPIERMETDDSRIATDTANSNPKFKRAEEKAAKAIQKHSMLIGGTEYNEMIDEAYLLLGKARYYDQRFIPALEAFNYIERFMPDSDNLIRSKIWRERVNLRIENTEVALENLQQLLATYEDEMTDEDRALLHATFSQAYIDLEQEEQAIEHINTAAAITDNRDSEARYHFITGQLYARSGQQDSAINHFDHIIELHRKIPRMYYINAFIEKIKLFDDSLENPNELRNTLLALEENRENRPFLDRIYFRRALYFQNYDSLPEAVDYYNRSLRLNPQDRYMAAETYRTLGDINFDNAVYATSGKYYDSALVDYTPRTPIYRSVKKKRDNLQDVILFEGQADRADSIFYVLDLSTEERESYYQTYIDTLRARDLRAEQAAEIAEQQAAQVRTATGTLQQQGGATPRRNTGPGGFAGTPADNMPPGISGNSASSFYFYNDRTVSRGKQQFKRRWGDRPLRDNWRIVDGLDTAEEGVNVDSLAELEEELKPEYTTVYYTDQLPNEQTYLDSLAKERDIAYYQLGVIYKEKFKRNDLAENKFTTLLDRDPAQRLVLPSLYNLYLIYEEEGAFAKANQIKSRIISDYPDTRYALALKNPNADLSENESSPKTVYTDIYREFSAGNYSDVIAETTKYIEVFGGDPIVPKLHLLKAFAAGRLYGLQNYKKELDYVALNFPSTEEGKKAEELVNEAEQMLQSKSFKPEKDLSNFKVVYSINGADAATQFAEELKTALSTTEKEFAVVVERYDPVTYFVMIADLGSRLGAKGVEELLQENTDIRPYNFIIASENYRIVQLHKNLSDYLQFSKDL